MNETFGPNVKKQIIHKISIDAIPKGGNVSDGIKFLTDKERISKTIREADQWVKQAIQAVRQAGKPNPFVNASDEEIAGEILRKIDEKREIRKAKNREAK